MRLSVISGWAQKNHKVLKMGEGGRGPRTRGWTFEIKIKPKAACLYAEIWTEKGATSQGIWAASVIRNARN